MESDVNLPEFEDCERALEEEYRALLQPIREFLQTRRLLTPLGCAWTG